MTYEKYLMDCERWRINPGMTREQFESKKEDSRHLNLKTSKGKPASFKQHLKEVVKCK